MVPRVPRNILWITAISIFVILNNSRFASRAGTSWNGVVTMSHFSWLSLWQTAVSGNFVPKNTNIHRVQRTLGTMWKCLSVSWRASIGFRGWGAVFGSWFIPDYFSRNGWLCVQLMYKRWCLLDDRRFALQGRLQQKTASIGMTNATSASAWSLRISRLTMIIFMTDIAVSKK